MKGLYKGPCRTCAYWTMKVGEGGEVACTHPDNQKKVVSNETLSRWVDACNNIISQHGVERGLSMVIQFISDEPIPRVRVSQKRRPDDWCPLWEGGDMLPDPDKKVDGRALIILGYGPTRDWAGRIIPKHGAENVDLWTVNADRGIDWNEVWSAHFEIHDPIQSDVDDIRVRAANKDFEFTFYTKENYPIDKIFRPDRLCSTIDYELALAETMGYEYIYLPGVDFWGRREEDFEARGAEYRIGRLEGMGRKVWTSPLSMMFRPFHYGPVEDKK